MKGKVSLDDIIKMLENNNFEAINKVIIDMQSSSVKTLDDIAILDFLAQNDKLSESSRSYLSELKDTYIAEMEIENTGNIENDDVPVIDEHLDDTVAPRISEDVQDISQQANDDFKKKMEECNLTVKEYSKNDQKPYVTFEINNISKPYLDNLMLRLYNHSDLNTGILLTKLNSTQEELFTIFLDSKDLSMEEQISKRLEVFSEIEKIVYSTDKEADNKYEDLMPDSLKNMKSIIKNDYPDLPDGNYKIGCYNDNGVNSFYVMAKTTEDAHKITEKMGYKVSGEVQDGVVQIDTEFKDMNDTKVSEASQDMNNTYVNEKPKVKTIGDMPVRPADITSDFAYTNVYNVLLVIALIFVVIVIVSFMVIE